MSVENTSDTIWNQPAAFRVVAQCRLHVPYDFKMHRIHFCVNILCVILTVHSDNYLETHRRVFFSYRDVFDCLCGRKPLVSVLFARELYQSIEAH
jgi:hypothetical protein